MQTKDFFWRYFQQTGVIGAYLLYRNLEEEEEYFPLPLAEEE